MLTRIAVAVVGLVLVTSAAWATFGYYSAVAMDPDTGAYGWSTGWLFQNQAEADALRRCRSNPNGSHCKVGLVFNSCGAVTTGTNGAYFGVGLTQDLANSRAMHACGKDANHHCKIIISFCSAEGQAPAPGMPTPRPSPTPSTPAQPAPIRVCPPGSYSGLGGCYAY
jgi:uncharacterized protein DUF4189